LLNQDGYEVLLKCHQHGIAVINAEIFCSGALWGLPYYDHSPITAEITSRIQAWQMVVATAVESLPGLTLPELALHFALLPGIVQRVCIGMCGQSEVDDNLKLFQKERSASERECIYQLLRNAQAQGLLRADMDLAFLSNSGS